MLTRKKLALIALLSILSPILFVLVLIKDGIGDEFCDATVLQESGSCVIDYPNVLVFTLITGLVLMAICLIIYAIYQTLQRFFR